MATAAEIVSTAYLDFLGRAGGPTGKAYWEGAWTDHVAKAKTRGMSDTDAQAYATGEVRRQIGDSAEARSYSGRQNRTNLNYQTGPFSDTDYAKTDRDLLTGDYAVGGALNLDGSYDIDWVPDWYTPGTYTFEDDNEYQRGTRDVDWATKLNTTNLANFLDNQNYLYGTMQGNTVGQEGNEWWGYTTQQGIDWYMSDAGGNYSFDTARKLANRTVARDIGLHDSVKNFKRYGSIGYGNPLDIKVAQEANVGSIPADDAFGIDSVYLNFNQKAMDELKKGQHGVSGTVDEAGNLITTGNQMVDPYYIDDDGNAVTAASDYTGDGLITDTPASKFRYVQDASAPGGYRITADPAHELSKVVSGESSATGDQGTLVSGYINNRGKKTFSIPTDVVNVDASKFTLPSTDPDNLTLATWAENPANKAAIAAGDFSYKNAGTGLVEHTGAFYPGGPITTQLVHVGTNQVGGTATNLGLDNNENLVVNNTGLSIIQDDGTLVDLSNTTTGGSTNSQPLTGGTTVTAPTVLGGGGPGGGGPGGGGPGGGGTGFGSIPVGGQPQAMMYYGGGGGNKTIIATPPPQSKTAKDQRPQAGPDRIISQASKKDQYNKIRGGGVTRIPGAGGGLSIPLG